MKVKAADLVPERGDAAFSRAVQLIFFGTTLITAGLVLSLTAARTGAGWVFLAGIILAIFGLHKYGRSGPSPLLLSGRSEEHTSELQSRENLVCRLLL